MVRIALYVVIGACLGAEEKAMGGEKGLGPPKGREWVAIGELTDEFEGGRLDAAKWHDHNPTWKGRQPAFFAKHNVTVSDGKLHLTMRKEDLKGLPEGYHTFTSAAVKSRTAVRYGYFEIKCRPMDSHGSSAFWFYAQTPEIWTEIDMFEMGAAAPEHQHIVHMNAHVFHTLTNPDRHWSRGGKWKAPYRLADAFHVYALEWDAEKLKYYVDGAVVREMTNTHWHQPLHLNFDSETMPRWFGLPDAKDLPSTFSIEYVRSWRKA
ncbi:MAG: family 16 glycosylhydrolase, partial [Phycisphaerae bacterium]